MFYHPETKKVSPGVFATGCGNDISDGLAAADERRE